VETNQLPGNEAPQPTVPAEQDIKESAATDVAIEQATPLPLPGRPESPNEFIWLFEYGLEMDAVFLNDRERLNSSAHLYGPAVLKGYRISFDAVASSAGQVVATILPHSGYNAAVWGVLYRIPLRLIEAPGDEPPPLDKIHPASYFEPLDVVVYEPYRKRELACITYIASTFARQQFHVLPLEQQSIDPWYAKHLLESARQHKFPGEYLRELLVCTATKGETQPTPLEQNTEPLAVVPAKTDARPSTAAMSGSSNLASRNRWPMALAVYLLLLLLAALSLAVIQGLALLNTLFTARFAPLGVPWFVLLYGLLGGCVSCIVMLGRQHTTNPPGFVVVTWFARPYIGALLAALAYLALNSGILVLTGSVRQPGALFSLVGALAGLCEGWIFYRRV
jgi:hypothetical protein